MSLKVLSVVGARPQFVKAAAVSRSIAGRDDMTEVLVHTGQHRDPELSDVFFSELRIRKPDHHLNISGGTHGDMTGRMLVAVERVMIEEKPDVVLVYGDTNSTLAGALAAAKLLYPIAHVESGLRSFNKSMPEEINRVVTDHVSELLFCPTEAAVENLRNEGIVDHVHLVGDVMYDAALYAAGRPDARSDVLKRLGLEKRAYAVATVHRAANTDTREALSRVLDWLGEAAREQIVVMPLHPRTRKAAERFGLSFEGLRIVAPLGYFDMAALVGGAQAIFTDSGGLQKEAYFHHKRCVTLRDETEWVETIACGWNRLWTESEYRPQKNIDEYGDGRAAERLLDCLAAHFP